MTPSPWKARPAAGALPPHPGSGKKSSGEMPSRKLQKCHTLPPAAEEVSNEEAQTTAQRFSSTRFYIDPPSPPLSLTPDLVSVLAQRCASRKLSHERTLRGWSSGSSGLHTAKPPWLSTWG